MADFVAVIRKAIGNLPENTPENRVKVYDKARAAIKRQLEAINPRPSDEVIARQLDKLDLAISEVESEHTEALAEEQDTDALMAELESLIEKRAPMPSPSPSASADRPEPAASRPEVRAPAAVASKPAADGYGIQTAAKPPFLSGEDHDNAFGIGTPASGRRPAGAQPAAPKRKKGGLITLVVLLALAGGAYAAWMNRDMLADLLGIDLAGMSDKAATAPEVMEPMPAMEQTDKPTEPPATSVPDDGKAASGKFTQRLNPDGTETDAGPAPLAEEAGTGAVEGRSVAGLTDKGPVDTGPKPEESPTAPDEAGVAGETATAPDGAAETAAPVSEPLGVAQKMYLYEERLDQQSPTVMEGSVIWTLVENPGDDGRVNASIRGEITSPDNGLSALLTISRNADKSLPASHIIEIVFAISDAFAGGSIDQVQRIALKQTEQDQGNPLIAVPAKITQDFYMIALNDLKEAVDENTQLLRQRNWIDIPVIYANGRRALITIEKGASGVEVFNKALDDWARP